MKNQILLFSALILFSISFVNAELLISPTNWEISVKKDVSSSFSVNLTNTFSFPITDFEFKNLSGFIFPNITIQPNQSVIVNYNVLQNSLIQYSKDVPVNFKYLVDIPVNPVTIKINITETGFNPNFVTIHEGDTVIWTNGDDVSHTVTSGSFDSDEIAPGSSYTRTFNQMGTLDYQDFILLWAGQIQILNRSSAEKVNNPNYNKIIHVNLNVYSDPTNLTFSILDENYTVDSSSTADGMISIKNIGSQIANKITLTADKWIVFEKNNFDLAINQQIYVPFKIKPLLLANNQTNQTYSINIFANGLNVEQYSSKINVYIPYSNVEDMGTDQGFLVFYAKFCEQNPTFAICTGMVNGSGDNGKIIYRDPEIPINLTSTQVYAMLKRIQQIQDSNARTDNEVKELKNQLSQEIPEIRGLLNQSVSISQANKEKSDTNTHLFWIVLVMGIFGIIAITVTFQIVKLQRKRSMLVKTKP